MTENQPQLPEDPGGTLPPVFHAHLRSLYTPPTAYPPHRDAALLARIHRQHARTRRWLLSSAIAAAVALAAGTLLYLELPARQPAASPYARTGDIRDAFYLARQLKAHQPVAANWDQNHDGIVDQADVRSLALAAVRISPAGEGAPR